MARPCFKGLSNLLVISNLLYFEAEFYPITTVWAVIFEGEFYFTNEVCFRKIHIIIVIMSYAVLQNPVLSFLGKSVKITAFTVFYHENLALKMYIKYI